MKAGLRWAASTRRARLFAESRYFVARDSSTGRMLAFASFVPIFGAEAVEGWTLDLMRRQAEALHGVMDFLIVSAARRFASEGARILSLGLSPLAGADDPAEAAATSHVRRFLYTRLNRAYNFQGLHTFKGKFATHWEPRFLVYSGRLALATASAAVLKAHLTAPVSSASQNVWRGRATQKRAFAACALLLLGIIPLEKTLAKQSVSHPLSYSRLAIRHWGLHRFDFHHLGIRHLKLHRSVQA